MASTSGPVQLVGDFKNLYQESGLIDAVPTWAVCQDRFVFEEAEATGAYYIFGVVLQRENGATYAPSSGASSGPQSLNASIAGYVGQAQVEGFAIYMRSRLSYDAASKASRAGKKAFAQAYGAVLKNLKESHQYRLEVSLLYGQDGLGTVDSNDGSGGLTLTAASWATGIWAAGLKDAILEAFTTVAASATQHNGDLTITNVSVANKKVTVSGTSSAVVAGDILYFKGARTTTGWNECPGLHKVLTNSGTLFNISASSYDAWQSQSYAVNGSLSMTAIMQGAALGMNYGLEDALLFCAPEKFAQLGTDEAALRRYISRQDSERTKRGAKGISFMMGQVDVEVAAHPFIKQGEAFMLPTEYVHRAGSTDITFGMPGTGQPMEVHVTDVTALEMRSMSDQGIFIEKPAQAVLLSSIS